MATAESKTFPYVLLPLMAVRQLFGAYQPPAHVKLSSSSAPGRFSCSAPSPQTVSIPHGDAARQRRYLVTPNGVTLYHWWVSLYHPEAL